MNNQNQVTIKYYTREVYGNQMIYAADHEQAWRLRILTGTKTLGVQHMRALEEVANVKFERVFGPVKVGE